MAVLPITAAASILTAKITIEASGAQVYGYINTIALLFQLLPFADFGVGAPVTSAVARRGLSRRAQATCRTTLQRALRVLVLSSGALSVVVVLLAIFRLWPTMLGIPPEHAETANSAACVSICIFLLAVPAGLGQRILIGAGKSKTFSLIGVVLPLTVLTYTYLASLLELEPLFFAIGSSLAVFVTNAIAFVLGLKAIDLSFRETVGQIFRSQDRKRSPLFDAAGPMLITTITSALAIQGHRLLLAHFGTPEELTQYSLIAQLYFPIWSVVYMSSTVLWPHFSRSEQQPGLWLKSNLLLMAVGLSGAAGLVLVGPVVVRLIAGEDLTVPTAIYYWFAVWLIVAALNSTQAMLLTRPSRIRLQALLSTLMLLTSVPLSIGLAPTIGAAAPVAGTAIAIVFCQLVPGLLAGLRIVTGVDSPPSQRRPEEDNLSASV
ncbi:hypothetical protein [Pseudarthrobacter equi]|uniref:lipopolysaccharide biosynthesis protein n=1 Tax=Pseudarthrobacter equi TaxID=728066 RepID=UPI0028D64C8E|nr:hypothetical protein [Pseudarthrobacter equi]